MDRKRMIERAYYLTSKYPERIIIEFDCGHDGGKHKHHYDYNKPFNVHLLCWHCHAVIHHPKKISNIKTMDKNIKDFPSDLNKRLHIEAANSGLTIKDLIINALEYYLNKVLLNKGDVVIKKSDTKE